MNVVSSVEALIGNTPLLALNRYFGDNPPAARVLVKLESFNPAGSAKDRPALYMLRDYEEKGFLRAGGTVIEPTSGNTGVALASLCAARGYRAIFTMPETMSVERRLLLAAYGAEIVLTDGKKGMAGAVEKAEELKKAIPGAVIAGQFENPANPRAHEETTGPELWRATDGQIDAFIAGIGTGGTITGTGRYLKRMNPEIRIVGVEPENSPLLTKGVAGAHGLMGIGANFVPKALDVSALDEILTATEADAYACARKLARREGVLAGITGGAALSAAERIANRAEFAGKTIVALLPDGGERYLSTALYARGEGE